MKICSRCSTQKRGSSQMGKTNSLCVWISMLCQAIWRWRPKCGKKQRPSQFYQPNCFWKWDGETDWKRPDWGKALTILRSLLLRNFFQTLFSSSRSSETRTPSPTTAPGSEEARNVDAVIGMIDQVLASATPTASNSDSPSLDQILTAVSAPASQSPNHSTPAANPASLPHKPETRKTPKMQMTPGEPSAAENQDTAAPPQSSPPSDESPPSTTPVNPFENAPQEQNAPSKSPLPSSRSNATSKTGNKATTGKSGGKSDFKPHVTVAKGADPRLRKGPNDSLLLWVDTQRRTNISKKFHRCCYMVLQDGLWSLGGSRSSFKERTSTEQRKRPQSAQQKLECQGSDNAIYVHATCKRDWYY